MKPELLRQISITMDQCIECPKCQEQCAFLKKYGKPKEIAMEYDPSDLTWLTLPFECHLCNLCSALCPVNLSPGTMFLEMRREAVERGVAPLAAHRGIIAYEARGVSRKYSWYSLPDGCHTILFPGCTFSGTRPDTTLALYEHIKTIDPDIGIVLDCCCKPSHDLGRTFFFNEMFNEMRSWLVEHGVRTIVVACPNCYKVFRNYGTPLEVKSAYEFLLEHGVPATAQKYRSTSEDKSSDPLSKRAALSIHDPCVLRDEPAIQSAVRTLAQSAGFEIREMAHSKRRTLCCGEGGSVGFISPKLSSAWGDVRAKEAENSHLLTYCAGCAGFLNRRVPTFHIIDALFYPESVAAGTRKVARAPFTYFNRVRLKQNLKSNHIAPTTRERDFTPLPDTTESIRGGNLRKIIIFITVAAAVAGIHFSGVTELFNQDSLHQRVASLGAVAPVGFILLYTIAPVLFLPGLPITIAGGIIFGPFWGVVYSIIGATSGASVAFLISRYVARQWVERKLTSPRWQQLNSSVEKNGWKIVAFTRLVPLFPFNLLNYAFGLTPVRFIPYALTSAICMLPACIAFIVFSSSLPDLLKGNVSTGLIVGIALIALVSLIPVMIKRYSDNKKYSK